MTGFVVDWARYHARVNPQRRATVDLHSGRARTYAELHERVGRVARLLLELGVAPGDRVGVLSLNSTDVLDIVLGSWRIGATHLALNFRLTASELEFILGDAEPVVVFYDTSFADTVAALRAGAPGADWVAMDGSGADEFEDRLATVADWVADPAPAGLGDRAMLMYSSGTTGSPKGVVITRGMILGSILNGVAFGIARDVVSYAVVPLFHIGGMMGFSLPVLFAGGTAVIERSFEPERVFDAIENAALGITHIFLVPAIWAALRNHPRARSTDYSRLLGAFGGAEPMPPALIHWWHERGVKIREVYGMTETTGGATVLDERDVPARAGSAGQPLMHIELKVMRLDGVPASAGEIGELWMRGPSVMSEYWRNPEATAETVVDGWLRSGDLARIDEAGYVTIEDRLKDMYISGGENVYPAEIEAVLYQLEAIREVAVIGVPHPQWGEAGCAVIALHGGADCDEEEILNHCAERLAGYKRPRKLVFVEALPRNATGKVLKFELRQRYAGDVEGGP